MPRLIAAAVLWSLIACGDDRGPVDMTVAPDLSVPSDSGTEPDAPEACLPDGAECSGPQCCGICVESMGRGQCV